MPTTQRNYGTTIRCKDCGHLLWQCKDLPRANILNENTIPQRVYTKNKGKCPGCGKRIPQGEAFKNAMSFECPPAVLTKQELEAWYVRHHPQLRRQLQRKNREVVW